jgi:hypothetical protein
MHTKKHAFFLCIGTFFLKILYSVVDPGCLSRIPDRISIFNPKNCFYVQLGSRIRIFFYPGSQIVHPTRYLYNPGAPELVG